MKSLTALYLTLLAINAFGAPCGGAPGHIHMNPDGSTGGFVQNTSRVPDSVYISADSEICGKVVIVGSPRIEAGSRIHENVTIQGSPIIRDSYIFGYAKISGGAVVQASEVCQASLIEGIKVIKSNYYCQTEDPQPKDPGEEGTRTLLGVDSDGDGVRDDIEIFINNSLSNTPKKNYSQERTGMKAYARILQKELLQRSNESAIENLKQEKTDILNCYPLDFSKRVFVKMYNTKERLYAMFKVAGVMHGKEIKMPSKTCKDIRRSLFSL